MGALGTAVDEAVDYDLPPECPKMLRDIVVHVFCRAMLSNPLARAEPMTVRLQPGARAVRATPRGSPIVHVGGDENCWVYLLSPWVTRPEGLVCVHASIKYTEVLLLGATRFVHGV